METTETFLMKLKQFVQNYAICFYFYVLEDNCTLYLNTRCTAFVANDAKINNINSFVFYY